MLKRISNCLKKGFFLLLKFCFLLLQSVLVIYKNEGTVEDFI